MMKTTRPFTLLLASIALLSAEDYAGSSGKTYENVAPNGHFSVRAHQENGYYNFNVEIMDLTSHKPVLVFDPKARFIGAAWSPDSKFVAIEQNLTTHDSAVSIYSLGKQTARQIGLPKGCGCDEESAAVFESPTRKHAGKTDSLKFHITMADYQIAKWSAPDQLVLSAAGRGWWGGDVAKDQDTRFEAEYEITIHFAADGTPSTRKLALKKYDEL